MKKLYILAILLTFAIFTSAAGPLIVAHRGASKDAPENTIAAFELAWQQGADAIEGDFYLAKDNKIVCIHDADTEKVAGKKLIVKDSLLKDLKKLDVGSHNDKKYKDQVIPTIAEVLATVPKGKKIYIEVKDTERIIPYLLEEIKKSKLKPHQVVIISFKEKVIELIKKNAPQYKANWLCSFKKDKITRKVTPTLETVLKTLKQINADGFSSGKDLIDQNFIKNVMQAGFEYHVWTVDDLETALRFQDWGAMSITTNVPGYMKTNIGRPVTEYKTEISIFHTSPARWDSPRIFHSPVDTGYSDRISIQKIDKRDFDSKTISDNKAYWFKIEKTIDENNNADLSLYIFNERDYLVRIFIPDTDNRYDGEIKWINEKLIYFQWWRGRILGGYMIIDAETEKIIQMEAVNYGGIAFQQFQQAKNK